MISITKLNFYRCSIVLWTISWAYTIVSCSNAPQQNDSVIGEKDTTSIAKEASKVPVMDEWVAPDTSSIPLNKDGDLIRYGRKLVANTAFYLGPKGKVSSVSNGMDCQNCHLEAGTKLFANSFSAVHSIYPKFRPRSGSIENLEKRINDCMERSLNGTKLDSLSHEMRAMVAYINWVGKDVEKGISPAGASVVAVPYLDRAADPAKGEIAFQKSCIICHGRQGQGILKADGISYLYPPLWGPNSYNTAAGMYRLSRLAGYIKSTMPNPLGSHLAPTLSDEESWDIAAYINSKPRPEKKFDTDWPDISKKPIDHPFGPYSDSFSESQHKFGPYKEIKATLTKH